MGPGTSPSAQHQLFFVVLLLVCLYFASLQLWGFILVPSSVCVQANNAIISLAMLLQPVWLLCFLRSCQASRYYGFCGGMCGTHQHCLAHFLLLFFCQRTLSIPLHKRCNLTEINAEPVFYDGVLMSTQFCLLQDENSYCCT